MFKGRQPIEILSSVLKLGCTLDFPKELLNTDA